MTVRSVLLAAFALLGVAACGDEPASTTVDPLSEVRPVGPVLRTFETPAGLAVFVLAEGHGSAAAVGDHVALRYTAYDRDGRVVDTNAGGAVGPAFLTLDGPASGAPSPSGWPARIDEGLLGVRAGGRRRIVRPAELRDAAAIFDVERVAVDPLGIEDLEIGDGPAARRGDLMHLRMTGRVADADRFFLAATGAGGREPFELRLVLARGQGLIEGLVQGLEGLRAGGTRRLRVPAALAYGEVGLRPDIPSGADLEFEIELVELLERLHVDSAKSPVEPTSAVTGTAPATDR